jgi:hypothetical protein
VKSDRDLSEYPPRIADMRQTLLSRIPCTAEGRIELEGEQLRGLIVHYLNYASRIVPPRAREVIFSDGFWTIPAQKFSTEVLAIEREIVAGVDIRARLSSKLFTDGYIARKNASNSRPAKKWNGKDFGLNAFGAHHLHIGVRDENGNVKHANPLLYVRFFRDCAVFLMIGHHKSFDDGSLAEAVGRWQARSGYEIKGIVGLSGQGTDFVEQTQIARRGLSSLAQVDGKIVPGANIATSGHSIEVSWFSGKVMEALKKIEPQLDDQLYVEQLFKQIADRLPKALKLVWTFDVCDLMLIAPQVEVAWRVMKIGC